VLVPKLGLSNSAVHSGYLGRMLAVLSAASRFVSRDSSVDIVSRLQAAGPIAILVPLILSPNRCLWDKAAVACV
jgi:hypothetical protein